MPEHPSIFASINRWTFPLIGLLGVGPLAAWPIMLLRAPDGAWDTTPILSDSPAMGLLAGAAALLLAGLWGLLTSLITSVRYGLFTTGLVLAWVTWSTGTTDLIMRTEHAAGHYWRLPIEGLIFGLIAVLIAGIIAGASRRPAAAEHGRTRTDAAGAHPSGPVAFQVLNGVLRGVSGTIALFRRDEEEDGANLGQRALIVLAASLIGALATWFVAVEALKGQAFAAAVVGSLLGATAGEMVASSGRSDAARAPVPLFFLAATILAIAGPIAAMAAHSGPAGVAQAATTAHLLPISRLLPLDWLAGAFVGVPIGLTWADALVDRAQKV